jgi:hypothetical protein
VAVCTCRRDFEAALDTPYLSAFRAICRPASVNAA